MTKEGVFININKKALTANVAKKLNDIYFPDLIFTQKTWRPLAFFAVKNNDRAERFHNFVTRVFVIRYSIVQGPFTCK